ncbi:hypothetical protein GGD46_003157 [Rhizobium lusitanum]|uniref:Uncharacterized protein n=1 Tax=Rhizobium lusitanum TaxID=293958 RepID=A0A7X0ISF3_9HYPH|nr:hypothetical protein [Rhizobium lusitanum]
MACEFMLNRDFGIEDGLGGEPPSPSGKNGVLCNVASPSHHSFIGAVPR